MNMIRFIKFIFILVGIAALSNCTTIQPPIASTTGMPMLEQTRTMLTTKPGESTQPKADPTQLSNWNIKGAVSIRSAQGGNLGAFNWQQNSKASYKIQVAGPLNMGSVQIIGRSKQITLIKSDGKQASASSPENLMQQQLGWYLPISNLYYWVRGLAAPGIPAQKSFDGAGHLTQLAQEGWNIQLRQFRSINNYELPTRLELYNPELKIKIVIHSWSV